MLTNLSLDSIRITDTRSRHEDTIYATVSIAVGANDPITQTKKVGNRNNGTWPVGIAVAADIPADGDVPVILSYVVMNNGHGTPTELENNIRGVLNGLGTKASEIAKTETGEVLGRLLGAAIGTAAVPLVGTAIGVLAGWVVGKVGNILFADCDGVVATGVRAFTSQQLIQSAGGGHMITETTSHPGVKSNAGCGANSQYFTTTTISATATTEVGMDLNGKWAAGGVAGPVISVEGSLISVAMPNRPPAHGTIVDGSTISVTFPDDHTFVGTLTPPNRIHWSNNTDWTRV